MRKSPFELLESRRATWVLLLAALLIRLGALFLVAGEPLTWDALGYFREARFLAEGISYSPKWPPGLPLYLSVFRLISPGEFIARASMLLWFLALALVGYRMTLDAVRGKRRSPEGTDESRFSANLFLLIFALYPLYIHQSVETLSQLPTAVGLLATAWLTLKVVRGAGVGTAVVLGCVLGATVLIRPTSLILLVGVPIYIAVRTKRALPPLVSLLPAVGIVGLWLLVAHHMTDHFVFINQANTWNLFLGNNPYTPLYKTWWLGSHTAGKPGVPSGFSRLVGEIRRLPTHLHSGRYAAVAWEEIIGRPHVFLLRSLNRVRTYLATDSFTGAHLHKVYAAPL
ncbi:hypothetical protein KAU45_02875, partial [bacterium]|nr:hypothetical protein [bacterium]